MQLLTRTGYRDIERRGFLDTPCVSPRSIELVLTPSGLPFRFGVECLILLDVLERNESGSFARSLADRPVLPVFGSTTY